MDGGGEEGETSQAKGGLTMGVYRRDDTWWIDYYVDGQRKREAVGPLKKEADAALGKKLALIREGRYFDVKKIKPITFDDMAVKFSE